MYVALARVIKQSLCCRQDFSLIFKFYIYLYIITRVKTVIFKGLRKSLFYLTYSNNNKHVIIGSNLNKVEIVTYIFPNSNDLLPT